MNVSSCSIVGLRNSGAVSRTKSFQNWPGASSTSGGGFSLISASSNPCASSVPAKDSSTTKVTSTPRSRSTRPIPTQLLVGPNAPRSEEHTSELQSLRHLVCRLLLEKQKNERTEI